MNELTMKKKKKILLLSDDFRLPSGIGTISKEIILNTVKEFDWVQLGSAIQHPDQGKAFDLSKEIQQKTGIEDADVKLIPWSGYGDKNILFSILEREQPDAIFHFTDPRYWVWLYQLEHEIKTKYQIPIIYYSIWDDLPYPMWNAPFYASSDLIMGISRQSHNIHKQVLDQNGFSTFDVDNKTPINVIDDETVFLSYVPHGLNHNIFKPLDSDDSLYKEMFDRIKIKNDVDFVVFWNNRNIRRKQPGDVVLSFAHFVSLLPEDTRSRVALLMHTDPVENNGTDLIEVAARIAPGCKVLFSREKLSAEELNAMYNVVDVTINIGSNEGWGLSSTESMLAGTPIINNVTGGLQDQCGFIDANGMPIIFDNEFPSNHTGRVTSHGIWVKPVYPSNRSLQGSPSTPYIFDDRVDFKDVATAINYWYCMSETDRTGSGLEGRRFCLENGLTAEQMGNKIIELVNLLFSINKPMRRAYYFNLVEEKQYTNMGVVLS
jgi:glycosyltransferase involved in cell wall biosynthesis